MKTADSFRLPAIAEPPVIRFLMVAGALLFLGLFILLPLIQILVMALSRGWKAYAAALTEPDALHAIRMTLKLAAVAVPINTVFGVALAWAITKNPCRSRRLIATLVDLPFSISPVIAGLLFVLLFGRQGWFHPWLEAHNLRIVFAFPGLVLATLFVTAPFVARELIPLMESQGNEEEEAARLLGASGWRIFWSVTLPNIKWGLIYGIILCNARAMGEFGAVSVVSGHIRGRTNTLPLHVEALFNEYNFSAAHAVASLLAGLALITLIVKAAAEWQVRRQRAAAERTRDEH
jgi:sulfate transport system permease protein